MTAEHDKQDAHQRASASADNAPRATYTPHPDVTPEAEIRALALVYKYVLECTERKETPEAGDDGVGVCRAGGPPKERSADEGSSA